MGRPRNRWSLLLVRDASGSQPHGEGPRRRSRGRTDVSGSAGTDDDRRPRGRGERLVLRRPPGLPPQGGELSPHDRGRGAGPRAPRGPPRPQRRVGSAGHRGRPHAEARHIPGCPAGQHHSRVPVAKHGRERRARRRHPRGPRPEARPPRHLGPSHAESGRKLRGPGRPCVPPPRRLAAGSARLPGRASPPDQRPGEEHRRRSGGDGPPVVPRDREAVPAPGARP